MTDQIPVKHRIGGLGEFEVGDTINWSWLSGVPVYATRWPAWGEVTGKPTTFAPAAHTHTWADITGTVPTWNQNTTGSAASLTTARTLKIGNAGKTFNGTENVTWTLAEIGAATSDHNHTLDGLSNVTITSNTEGEVLQWNGTAWINRTLAEAGILSTTGTAAAATMLATARTISLSGDATGSASFDGSGDVSIPVVVADDSHNHVISNVDGLQAALDGKLSTTGTAAAASTVAGTNLGKAGSRGGIENGLTSAEAWANKPIGFSSMLNSGSMSPASPTGFPYFFKVAQRQQNKGWGGLLIGYFDGDLYTATSQDGTDLPTFHKVSMDGQTHNTAGITFAADNTYNVGSATARPIQYYGVNANISTSDARLKTDPRDATAAEIAAFGAIARLPMVWQWLERVESEGDNARLHSGPTVQAAMAIMVANGLDWQRYSAFCYDEWDASRGDLLADGEEWDGETETVDETVADPDTGETSTVTRTYKVNPAGDRYSFRKEELLWWCMRALFAEHDALRARIEALEAT